MAAVIRMKRHIHENPIDAICLNRKKRKTTDGSPDSESLGETSTVLKFAGTVNEDTNIQEHIAKLTKEEAKDIISRKHNQKSKLKTRLEENRVKSQQNRFKIVNYTRALDESSPKTTDQQQVTIVDVEKDRSTTLMTPSTVAHSSSFSDIPDDPYVYDIYIADNNETLLQNSDDIDLNDLSILDYNDYLYSLPRFSNDSDPDEMDNDDEDSNDENNWRNDYPDEGEISDNDSIGEREMRHAMENCDLENDLSSSDDNNHDGFIYSIDSQGFSFEDDVDYCDVNRYGEAYARYKKRVTRELEEGSDENSSDDDSLVENDEEDEGTGSFYSD